MASNGNFSTLNPLVAISGVTFSQGNLKEVDDNSGWQSAWSTLAVKSGKFYFEARYTTDARNRGYIGVAQTQDLSTYQDSYYAGQTSNSAGWYSANGSVYINASTTGTTLNTYTTNDIVGCAIDIDNGYVYFSKNGTFENSGNPASGSSGTGGFSLSGSTSGDLWHLIVSNWGAGFHLNYGQDSTFAGAVSAGGNADANGFGDFKYSVPTGFLALSSANLPISDDIDPAQTNDDYPGKQFNCVTYTGNASTNAITGLGFQPDLVWVKVRNNGSNSYMADSSRGTNKIISSTLNEQEQTETNLTSFDTDGFTLSSNYNYLNNWNQNTWTYVAWCWRANGGVTSSNTQGDITTTVQANTKAGFSIFTYTGNGGGAGTSMGHGLSQAPDIWFLKQRSNNGESSQKNWRVMLNTGAGGAFRSLSGSSQTLVLNESSAAGGLYRNEGNFEPTSTVVQAPNNGNANSFFVVSGNTYVSYCWHSVEGYSKFGSYVGNGDADGPFIYTGFRPKMFFIKNIGATSNWHVYDTERSTFNVMNDTLNWNDTSAEQTDYAYQGFDVLSNGIKTRGSNGLANSSGVTYIYGAWGDVPFKYNNTF